MRYMDDRGRGVTACRGLWVAMLAACCVALAIGQTAASAADGASKGGSSGSGPLNGSLAESLLADGSVAIVPDQSTAYKITFDGDGKLVQALEIETIMPEGVVIEGREINVSKRLDNASADPILESDPQWFMELEAVPRIGPDAQLTGSSVIQYEEPASGTSESIVDAVRVVEQGRKDTITLPDGSESSGCNFISRRSVGRQAATAFIEIAYDPASCKRVVEFGVLSDADVTDLAMSEAADSGSANAALPTAPSVDSTNSDFRLEIPDYRAKTRSQVRELAYPVLPATSEVHAQVEVWNQKPQYSPSKWSWWSNWLSETGWRRDTHYAWSDRNSDYIYVGESSTYYNHFFANAVCSGAFPIPISPGTTYAGHTVQTIGYANLTVEHYVSNYKRGGCSYLLRTNQTDNFWWINRS